MSAASLYGPMLFGMVLLVVGEALHIVGLATPQWSLSDSNVMTTGLWEVCGITNCVKYRTKSVPAEMKVCQAFAMIGMFMGLLAAAFGLYSCVLTAVKKSTWPIAVLVCAAGNCALGSIIICAIVWGVSIHPAGATIGYSFILSVVGGIVHSLGEIPAMQDQCVNDVIRWYHSKWEKSQPYKTMCVNDVIRWYHSTWEKSQP